MKPQILAIALLLQTSSLFAQKDKDIPGWGKIDKADLEMKECEFDKSADAMILVEKGEVDYQRGTKYPFALKKEIRTRIKIFKEKGFSFADIKIPYYSDNSYEKLIDVDAVTYNLDASGKIAEIKVDKKSFFRQKMDANRSAVSFTFPEVKIGSIIKYKYIIIREAFSQIDPWTFQDNIPTRVSAFNISFPEYFKFVTNSRTSLPLESKKDESQRTLALSGENIRYRSEDFYYKMKNVPALKAEPYMGSFLDYVQRVEFQLSQLDFPNQPPIDFRNTWPRLVTSLLESEIFGVQIKKNLSPGPELEAQLRAAKSPYEKLISIYRFVQKTMEWNGVEDYYCESAKECWSKKNGSTGDINMILLNLLKDAGLDAYPLLASTRDHGRVYSAYPLLSQFNTLLVYVEVEDKVFILDAADKYNPAHLIPYEVLGTDAFLVDKEKSGFITLWEGRFLHKNMISISGVIGDDDILRGDVNVNSYDYARNPRVKEFKVGKDKFTTKYITGEVNNMKVEGLEVNNTDKDSMALEQKFKFSLPVTGSGDYKYFTVNLFSELEKNPFISDNRQTNIDFGYNQYYMMVGSIAIPDGYQFEEHPKNMMMVMPDTSIVLRRIMETVNDRINYRITLEFRRPFYEVAEYEEFKEFYKKLYATLNEQIVFKKKAAPKP